MDPVQPRREPAAAPARNPRTVTTAASVAGGAAVWAAAANLDNGVLVQIIVFIVVAALGVAVPSLRLTDPATRQPLTRDSSLSSIILSLATALGTAWMAGDIPLPDSARGFLSALVALYSGTVAPSVVGSALGRRRAVRGPGGAGTARL
jgi:hypothetical protein